MCFIDGVPSTLVFRSLYHAGYKRPERAEDGEHNEIVQDEEGKQFGDNMPITSGLGLVATLYGHASENHGQDKINQRCDGRSSQTLYDTPDSLVRQQRLVEGLPNLAKVGQVDEKDGDEGVGSDPEQGENEDPEVVGHALATASRRGQRHVGPDDVHWLGGQDDGGVVGMLLAARVGNTVRFGNIRVTSKSVGHRATLIH